MESLYAILFSNGHIKVGRTTDLVARIAAHRDRVACLGITQSDGIHYFCEQPASVRESWLIAKCVQAASARHQNEWFAGLDFATVCEWVKFAADMQVASVSPKGHLRDYLQSPGAMTVMQLREAMNALGADLRDDAQIRQWIAVDAEGNFKRQPGAGYAMYLERATYGKVTRQCMRPDDFRAIWPELDARVPAIPS